MLAHRLRYSLIWLDGTGRFEQYQIRPASSALRAGLETPDCNLESMPPRARFWHALGRMKPRPTTMQALAHAPRPLIRAAPVVLGLAALTWAVLARRRRRSPFPRDPQLDSTVALLREGYTFISTRCRRYHSDVFEARLMLRRAFCMLGEEATRMFYVPDRFARRGAMPVTTLLLLQDLGSVQMLERRAHRWRKQMFMSLLTEPAAVRRLVELAAREWRVRVQAWGRMPQVVLHDEARDVLCRSVCAWAGVPLAEADVARRTREFGAMIDGSGRIGPQNWHAQRLRASTERWIRRVVADIRSGRLRPGDDTAAHAIAWHRGPDGRLLDARTAAVELINVLRPTIAVARFVTFAALAMHDHPDCRRRLQEDTADGYLESFVQEVRRFYPFFPAVGGRVQIPFDWRGHHFARGTWVLLDLYGTNHDPRIWGDPDVFRPERFQKWDGSPFTLVPQGGGRHSEGHRCPGEAITIELTKAAVRQLAAIEYDVPSQELRIDMTSMPAVPASRFLLANVRTRSPR